MSSKMSFGKFIANSTTGLNKVVKVDAGYFNSDGIREIAESIDTTAALAQLEGRKLNSLESFAIEVLLGMAGFESPTAAYLAYEKHKEFLKSKEEDV